jgi:tetratricopeptide (TPR) repeat protein
MTVQTVETGRIQMDEVTPKRKLRRLRFHVLLTTAIVAVGFAQQNVEEAEIRRGYKFRAEGQLDSSIAHFELGKNLLKLSTRRELYYQCISGIADDLLRKTQFGRADSLLRVAEIDVRRELGDGHSVTSELYALLGYLRTYQDRFTEAKGYYSRALEIREKIYGSDDLQVAALYYGLGLVCMRNGEFSLALQDLSKAQAIQQLRPDTAQVDLANTLVAIGHVFDMNSEPSKAIEAYSNASALLSKSNLGASPAAAICYHFLAVCFKSLGQLAKSVDYEKQALEIYRTVYGENHLATAASLAQLGDHLVLTGDFDRALKCYQESRSIVSGLLGPNHSSMDEVNRKIAGLYATRNDFEDALKIDLRVASPLPRNRRNLSEEG